MAMTGRAGVSGVGVYLSFRSVVKIDATFKILNGAFANVDGKRFKAAAAILTVLGTTRTSHVALV